MSPVYHTTNNYPKFAGSLMRAGDPHFASVKHSSNITFYRLLNAMCRYLVVSHRAVLQFGSQPRYGSSFAAMTFLYLTFFIDVHLPEKTDNSKYQ